MVDFVADAIVRKKWMKQELSSERKRRAAHTFTMTTATHKPTYQVEEDPMLDLGYRRQNLITVESNDYGST
jgi:hypothetical protein